MTFTETLIGFIITLLFVFVILGIAVRIYARLINVNAANLENKNMMFFDNETKEAFK